MPINEEEIRTKLESLRARLSIDPTNLESECIDQPILYDEIGELATEYQSKAKEAKNHLDFVHADQASKVRKSPSGFGVEKVTEGSVENAVILTKEYQDASNDLVVAEKIVGYLRILQTSVEQRKSMLNNLVTLFVHNYYSGEQQMAGERQALGKSVESDVLKDRQKRRNNETLQEGQESEG